MLRPVGNPLDEKVNTCPSGSVKKLLRFRLKACPTVPTWAAMVVLVGGRLGVETVQAVRKSQTNESTVPPCRA